MLALDKEKKSERKRLTIQLLWTLITNAFVVGFARGDIYQGKLKSVCVPGLNCYSCPGAIASCPIGALQAVLGSYEFRLPLFVTGFLILVGTICGRFVCGFLCPFGLVQDLLYRIPFPKKWRTFPGDRPLRFLKFLVLAVFVVALPLLVTDLIGQGYPWFCKLICPSGTLMGGIPLVSANETLQQSIGALFVWKMGLLLFLCLLGVVLCRPFCRYLCPLGAIYGLLQQASFYRLSVDQDACISCGQCARVCPMACEPTKRPNDMECIRCGRCKAACPTEAIEIGFLK